MQYGEYRSAREAARTSGKWGDAYAAACALGGEEREAAILDWWRCADLDEVAKLVVWGYDATSHQEHDSLWWMDEATWSLSLGCVVIASDAALDINTIAVKWARVPAEAVAHLHREWALTHDPDNAGVTQEVFDVLDTGDLERIKAAALAAADAAAASGAVWASWAASAASWAASAARAARAAEAAEAARAAASWAASAAASAAAAAAASDLPDRAEWARRWTLVVLEEIKRRML